MITRGASTQNDAMVALRAGPDVDTGVGSLTQDAMLIMEDMTMATTTAAVRRLRQRVTDIGEELTFSSKCEQGREETKD